VKKERRKREVDLAMTSISPSSHLADYSSDPTVMRHTKYYLNTLWNPHHVTQDKELLLEATPRE
jgi:hypothetical protein